MACSYIVRVYRQIKDDADQAMLIGVVENARCEQRSFRGIDELARLLEVDWAKGDTSKEGQRNE